MNDEKLLKLLLSSKVSDDEAVGMIFSNFIDIGGDLVGLTVENCMRAARLLRKYDSLTSESFLRCCGNCEHRRTISESDHKISMIEWCNNDKGKRDSSDICEDWILLVKLG